MPSTHLPSTRPARLALTALALLIGAGCEAPSSPDTGEPAAGAASGTAAPMSDASYDALPIDQQYRVANKLLATIYTGMPVEEFYSLEPGDALRARRDPSFTLSSLRTALATDLPNEQRAELDRQIDGDESAVRPSGKPEPLEPLFKFDQDRAKQVPIARMAHYPLSRDHFAQWMTWHLANTILFSPAEEIDSADMTDVQNLFRRLNIGIVSGTSIRAMIASHQRSVQNWRRFRSPEDNTREMMEIYLGLFDNDEEVPLASQACQDLYLTDEADGYKLAYTDYPNVEPVQVLGQSVTDCGDFYDVVAGHPLVIPRVTSILVDYFFTNHSVEQRLSLTEAISASNPVTFEDIFVAILFSEAYLMDVERPASFEETFLSMGARLQWEAHPDMPRGLASGRGALARADMDEMGWPTMSLKLGRAAGVPLDSLSFGNYHKAVRESLLLDINRWREPLALQAPSAPDPTPPTPPESDATQREQQAYRDALTAYEAEVSALSPGGQAAHARERSEWEAALARHERIDDLTVEQLIDYLMLAAAQRRATPPERGKLATLFVRENLLDPDLDNAFARRGRHDDIARIVFDYASRLPETYHLTRQR